MSEGEKGWVELVEQDIATQRRRVEVELWMATLEVSKLEAKVVELEGRLDGQAWVDLIAERDRLREDADEYFTRYQQVLNVAAELTAERDDYRARLKAANADYISLTAEAARWKAANEQYVERCGVTYVREIKITPWRLANLNATPSVRQVAPTSAATDPLAVI